jgi:hypothetical protein
MKRLRLFWPLFFAIWTILGATYCGHFLAEFISTKNPFAGLEAMLLAYASINAFGLLISTAAPHPASDD